MSEADRLKSSFGDSSVREEFQLGSASNITRLKKALIDRELIEMNNRKLVITDPVFKRWFIDRGL